MSIYQGDPALFLSENGANIKFTGGQPRMDQGFHNAVLISLLTKPGWWGNALVNEESKKIGSDYIDSLKQAITLTSINDVRDKSEKAIKWMTDKGIANSEVTVNNPSGSRTDTLVFLQPPGQDIQSIKLSSNGLNWKAQAENPASGE